MRITPQELCDALNIDVRDVQDIKELSESKVKITFHDGHKAVFKIESDTHKRVTS